MKITKYDFGFTLAEVLITLGIIGVVAAITIPILLNSYQKVQYVTTLKKAYAQFNEVISQVAAENNCPGDLVCTKLFTATNQNLGEEIVKHYKVLKNCQLNTGQGCMPTSVKPNIDGSGTPLNYDDGSFWETSGGYSFITIDGVSIMVSGGDSDCSWDNSTHRTGNLTQTCKEVIFDITGPTKGPNIGGRDVFTYWLSNGKGPLLYPLGGADDSNSGWWTNGYCWPGDVLSGEYCAARIMEEGWKMSY